MNEEKQSNNGELLGNIWITSKTRMQSHARFAQYDLLSYGVLTTYSIILLTLSVFEGHLANTQLGTYTSEISIILSVSILYASVVIWGLRFGKTADEHRQCYLALQKLHGDQGQSKIKSDYHEILDKYPNHSEFDYEKTLYTNIWVQKNTLRNQEGKIHFGRRRLLRFRLRRLGRLLLGMFIILLPLIILGPIFYVAI